jgi:uncharacterized RDD family membrane protein YckC
VSVERSEEAAGFASRAVAFVTDAVIFGASHALIAWTIVQVATLLARPSLGDRLGPWIVTIGGVVLAVAYSVVSWSWFGRTPGKALLGLAVTTQDGAPLGVLRSLLRFVGYLLSTIPLGAGFLWILIDDHRRGWHDHLAGTRVVYRPSARIAQRESLETAAGSPGSD